MLLWEQKPFRTLRASSASSAHDAWLILSPVSHSLLLLVRISGSLLLSPNVNHSTAWIPASDAGTAPLRKKTFFYLIVLYSTGCFSVKTKDWVWWRRGKKRAKRDVTRDRSAAYLSQQFCHVLKQRLSHKADWLLGSKRATCEPQGKTW